MFAINSAFRDKLHRLEPEMEDMVFARGISGL